MSSFFVHMKSFIISRLCFNQLFYNAFLSTHSFVYACEKTRIMKLIKLTNQLSECIKKHLFIIITESKEHKFRIAI